MAEEKACHTCRHHVISGPEHWCAKGSNLHRMLETRAHNALPDAGELCALGWRKLESTDGCDDWQSAEDVTGPA